MTESLINKLKSLQIINPDINNFETIKEEYNIIDNKNEVEFMQQILKNIIVILPENIDTPEKIKFACIEYLGNDPPNATPRVKQSVIEPKDVNKPVTVNPLIPSPSLSASSSRSETPSVFSSSNLTPSSSRSETPSVFSSSVTPNISRDVTPILNRRGIVRLNPLSPQNAARRNAISHSLKNRPLNNKSVKNPILPKSLLPPSTVSSSSSSAASSRAPSRAPSRPATGTIYATGPKTFVPQIFEFTIPSTGKIVTIQLNTTKEGISSTEGINKRIFKIVDDKIKIDTSKDRAEKYYDAIINIKEYTKEYDTEGYIILKPRNIKP
jgi:hypothetical protein